MLQHIGALQTSSIGENEVAFSSGSDEDASPTYVQGACVVIRRELWG
jgi:hypothetical protein